MNRRIIGMLLSAAVATVVTAGSAVTVDDCHETVVESDLRKSGFLEAWDVADYQSNGTEYFLVKVPAGMQVAVTVKRNEGVVNGDVKFYVRSQGEANHYLAKSGCSQEYVFTSDNEIVMGLLALENTGLDPWSAENHAASIAYEISFVYSPTKVAADAFTGEKPVTFRCAVLDSQGEVSGVRDAVIGLAEMKAAKANKTTDTSKLSGRISFFGGRHYSVNGKIPVRLKGPSDVTVTVKGLGTLVAQVTSDSLSGLIDRSYWLEPATIDRALNKETSFAMAKTDVQIPGCKKVFTELLPNGEPIHILGDKWGVAKAGKIKFSKSDLSVEAQGANPSGLRLTYNASSGTVKGGFTIYALKSGRLVKHYATVNGAVVSNVAQCLVTVKGTDWKSLATVIVK